MGGGSPEGGPSAGFLLSLLTESFAVRALLGSLVAVALAVVAIRWRWVRGPQARRIVILAPVLAAVAAGMASIVEAEAYLPQLWVTSSSVPSGQVLELLGELRGVSERGVDVLVFGWLVVVVVLIFRRIMGMVTTRRLVAAARPMAPDDPLMTVADRLQHAMGLRNVELKVLAACPGGALTTGTRRPVIVIDRGQMARLDDHEVEGLLAHELAHIARRDTLLATVVGLFADLTFFLPTVHWVRRWLHREREEGADALASRHTGRPAALASSILKVWQGGPAYRHTLSACSAVPAAARLPRPYRQNHPPASNAARAVATRVERLVSPLPSGTALRQSCEIALAALVVVAASAATVIVPRWIATELNTYSLAFGYVPPPAEPVESPAFATFRALVPTPVASDVPADLRRYERLAAAAHRNDSSSADACPCVENQAQWLAGVPATAPAQNQTMSWQRTTGPAWEVTPTSGSVHARPLLTLPESRLQVGFFVLAHPAD